MLYACLGCPGKALCYGRPIIFKHSRICNRVHVQRNAFCGIGRVLLTGLRGSAVVAGLACMKQQPYLQANHSADTSGGGP